MSRDDESTWRRQVGEVRTLIAQRAPVHLMGIGGVGMAGVAIHLKARGLNVSGCDSTPGSVTDWLSARGIPVETGHDPRHLGPATGWAIRSPAVHDTNPEVLEAIRRGMPVYRRGVVLPALLDRPTSIAVAGSHGKTTTSTMIASVLRGCGVSCGFAIGGEVDALGGVADAGSDPYMVVEADESDGTLALYESDLAVITNVELDHVDFFPDLDRVKACFRTFARQARRRVVACADDPVARELAGALPGSMLFGLSTDAGVRGEAIRETADGIGFDLVAGGRRLVRVELPLPGLHNVQNALGALAVGLELGLDPSRMAAALAAFKGARRRFERIIEQDGVLVISDYAHHPTEIRAFLKQAKTLGRRLVAVYQPHRYSRTLALGADFPPAFEGVDALALAPVYAASEPVIEGGTSLDLLRRFEEHRRVPCDYVESLEAAWAWLRKTVETGDAVLITGAGDVEKLAFRLKDELSRGTFWGGTRT